MVSGMVLLLGSYRGPRVDGPRAAPPGVVAPPSQATAGPWDGGPMSPGHRSRAASAALRRGYAGLELGDDGVGLGVVPCLLELVEVAARVQRALRVEGGENDLAAGLRDVATRGPLPDPEAQTVAREVRIAEGADALGKGQTGVLALARGVEPPHRAVVVVVQRQPGELDEREPRLGVPGQLLGERPDRDVRRDVEVRGLVLRDQWVDRLDGVRAPAHQLGELTEGLHVVGVLDELRPQGVLARQVGAPGGGGGLPGSRAPLGAAPGQQRLESLE